MRRQDRKRGDGRTGNQGARRADYGHLAHPFAPQAMFSDDAVAGLHETALRVLENLGVRFLLPEARALFAAAGAIVDEDRQMVRIGREIVAAALASAPRSIRLRAADPRHEQTYAPGRLLFGGSGGCPNATDRVRGRRPGSLSDYEDALKLQQHFDVIHILSPSAEPQDVPVHLRHYAMMRSQMLIGTKPLFAYARGRRQVADSFEMVRTALALDEAAWTDGVWCKTIINSNSPRLIDIPMAEGIIDFARAGQLTIITPFCLAGAMAPVTVAGALVLQHAEALACITLAQLAKPGAPVSYGGFSSNVDMKSGAPAFGTPEHVKMQIGSGQLARLIGLPWRSAAGSASNTADVQAATENMMGLWGAMMANATLTVHAAGWLEGGLTFGYEKFILDVEALQTIAELCARPEADAAAMAYEAIAEVDPGGHFFAAAHTMDRYDRAFYTPLVADLGNFGTWSENGAKTATERATGIWQRALAEFQPHAGAAAADERLAPFIARRTTEGGAAPSE
ncbi:trimethylamine methyltransferase family protein [Defluviimonas sp. WL0075]|uniref:Methyltransferase n=1 Tax=Albidovulum sediminicola TaxID=2984331 RepID=A0ABT2YWZ0_9RHOB|nr:trimethylamine methyltransferase family protein [Defluviimonas sp. WL0075]MCV2863396.1 trimethylamine methyltransferase family protein [Defluviimonas sp. WL0075]